MVSLIHNEFNSLFQPQLDRLWLVLLATFSCPFNNDLALRCIRLDRHELELHFTDRALGATL